MTRRPWPTGLLLLLTLATASLAQVPPEGADAEAPFVCRERGTPPPPPVDEAEALERETRARYQALFPVYVNAAGPVADVVLQVPVEGVRVAHVADTWGAARDGGRSHDGQDLFAPAGTPVRSATDGFLWRIGERPRGGLTITVIGGGGRRYYYAHLSAYGDVREGQRVTPDTILGYVGNTGNAVTTPPHLHFGVYESRDEDCGWDAIDPLPLLVDR